MTKEVLEGESNVDKSTLKIDKPMPQSEAAKELDASLLRRFPSWTEPFSFEIKTIHFWAGRFLLAARPLAAILQPHAATN